MCLIMLLLDKLVNFSIIVQKIKETCENYQWKSNNQLQYISQYIIIEKLNLCENKRITDESIKKLTNIHTLNLCENKRITDEGIKKLTNIHTLNLIYNENITDEGIKNLN